MYIECQECDTTFQLDESLLKPTGSKVRCSQCGHIFVAMPPTAAEPAPIEQEIAAPAATPSEPPPPAQTEEASSQPSEDKGQELQDVDLAELDTLFAQGQDIPSEKTDVVSDAAEVDAAVELDENDFEIDFEAALEADDSIAAMPAQEPAPTADAEGDADDLDLELDFDLGDDLDDLGTEEASPVMDKAAVESSEDIQVLRDVDDDASQDEFELALDDVDLDDGNDATVFADMASQDSEKQSVDLDQDATVFASPDEPVQDADISELDIDLDLDLDMEDESEAAAPAGTDSTPAESEAKNDIALDDDFFSDLDSILDGTHLDDSPDDSESKENVALELDDTPDESAVADQNAADEDLEELAFELDAEYEDKPIAQDDEGEPALDYDDTDSEIDLTEIELMLEGDGEGGIADVRSADDIGEKTSAGDDFDLGLEDEIDLAELTMAIEQADLSEANDTATIAENELELAFASEDGLDDAADISLDDHMDSPAQPATDESPAVDSSDDELDLSDLDDLVMEAPDVPEAPPAAERDVVDSGDIELEFQIEEEEQEATPQIQEQLDTLTPDTTPAIDQTLDMPKAEEEPKPARARKPKKKSSKLLLFILILLLLGIIGYGIYYADTKMGIKIPFVTDYITYISDYVTPKPKDPTGTANLSTLEINSKFIENEQDGRLFVITGKVHNGYQNNRGQIRLQGKIFTKGKVLAQTESIFAGTVLDDQQLATTPFADIKNQLATPPQNGTPGIKVLPNQNLAFMVVFSNLPPADDLEEFAVEVVKSLQVQ